MFLVKYLQEKTPHYYATGVRKDKYDVSKSNEHLPHSLLEAYNVIRKSSSEQIKLKWSNNSENKYILSEK